MLPGGWASLSSQEQDAKGPACLYEGARDGRQAFVARLLAEGVEPDHYKVLSSHDVGAWHTINDTAFLCVCC